MPSSWDRELIERVRTALPIQDVVGMFVRLRRVGTGFMARCPFHDDRTPSMSVDPDKGLYYCFGCGAGGDVFRFIEMTSSVSFQDALLIAAERAGVQLKKTRLSAAKRREHAAQAAAAQQLAEDAERLHDAFRRWLARYIRDIWATSRDFTEWAKDHLDDDDPRWAWEPVIYQMALHAERLERLQMYLDEVDADTVIDLHLQFRQEHPLTKAEQEHWSEKERIDRDFGAWVVGALADDGAGS
jgi:hypothetical protein